MAELMPQWLDRRSELSPNSLAIEFTDHQRITFVELQGRAKSFAKKMKQLNISKGDHVSILSHNHLDTVVAIFAMTYLGSVAVMLNAKLTQKELQYQLESSDSKLLLTTSQLKEEKTLDFKNIATFAEINKMSLTEEVPLITEIDLAWPFTMMFTSGTTGKPKAVIHTYSNHWWNATASALNLGLDPQDKWLLTLPIFHIGGFSILVKCIIYGMSVYFIEKYDKKEVITAFEEKKVTIASIVTVMLKDLIEYYDQKSFPDTVRCLLLGGGAVPKTMLTSVKQLRLPLFQSYGMTETTSQIATISQTDYKNKIGSSGKPLFPAQIKINNPSDDGIGEILVKGKTIFSGYYKHENDSNFIDDWFKTGDLGYIDKEGFLFVVDRRKDLIISGGENIYPSEVEQLLYRVSGVKEVAVVGQTDEKWGQVPVAYIVKDSNLTADIIKTYLNTNLASFKHPKKFYFVNSLPRTASNKVMRHALTQNKNE